MKVKISSVTISKMENKFLHASPAKLSTRKTSFEQYQDYRIMFSRYSPVIPSASKSVIFPHDDRSFVVKSSRRIIFKWKKSK